MNESGRSVARPRAGSGRRGVGRRRVDLEPGRLQAQRRRPGRPQRTARSLRISAPRTSLARGRQPRPSRGDPRKARTTLRTSPRRTRTHSLRAADAVETLDAEGSSTRAQFNWRSTMTTAEPTGFAFVMDRSISTRSSRAPRHRAPQGLPRRCLPASPSPRCRCCRRLRGLDRPLVLLARRIRTLATPPRAPRGSSAMNASRCCRAGASTGAPASNPRRTSSANALARSMSSPPAGSSPHRPRRWPSRCHRRTRGLSRSGSRRATGSASNSSPRHLRSPATNVSSAPTSAASSRFAAGSSTSSRRPAASRSDRVLGRRHRADARVPPPFTQRALHPVETAVIYPAVERRLDLFEPTLVDDGKAIPVPTDLVRPVPGGPDLVWQADEVRMVWEEEGLEPVPFGKAALLDTLPAGQPFAFEVRPRSLPADWRKGEAAARSCGRDGASRCPAHLGGALRHKRLRASNRVVADGRTATRARLCSPSRRATRPSARPRHRSPSGTQISARAA